MIKKSLKVLQEILNDNRLILVVILSVFLTGCSSKKDIFYFQNSENYVNEKVLYNNSLIQPNDILSIVVTTPIPEAAIPYNIQTIGVANFDIEALKLQGYLVSAQGKIDFPVLGELFVKGLDIKDAAKMIQRLLEEGGHLKDPSVKIRLLNAKVTILGEVNRPGTFTFTERSISLPQALGYASDLTILGKRKNVILIRERDGIRSINHIDLTTTEWMDGPFYYIEPNDVIVVNPNNTKVKSAGLVGNVGIVLTIASLILSSIVLITR